MVKYKYIISLGEDCFMRSLIDQYNMRDKFKIRMPFDGSVHPYEEMCRLIETDFLDYDKNIVLNNNIFYQSNGVVLNHEKTTDINILKNQLYKRIEQFKETLNEKENILFLIHNKNKNIDFNFNLIENSLKNKYSNLKYHIFVFNNYHEDFYINKTENTTYLNIFWNPNNISDFSNLNYDDINNDFIEQMYITPYGIDFSLKVLKEICSILSEYYNIFIFNNNYNFDNNLS
jgi:hypothetical protein